MTVTESKSSNVETNIEYASSYNKLEYAAQKVLGKLAKEMRFEHLMQDNNEDGIRNTIQWVKNLKNVKGKTKIALCICFC